MVQPVEHPTLGLLDGLKTAGFPLNSARAKRGTAARRSPRTRTIWGGFEELLGLSEAALTGWGRSK